MEGSMWGVHSWVCIFWIYMNLPRSTTTGLVWYFPFPATVATVPLALRISMAVRPFFLPTAPRGMCSTAHGRRESAWPAVTMAISMFLRFAGYQVNIPESWPRVALKLLIFFCIFLPGVSCKFWLVFPCIFPVDLPAEGQQRGVLPSHLCGTLGLCSATER